MVYGLMKTAPPAAASRAMSAHTQRPLNRGASHLNDPVREIVRDDLPMLFEREDVFANLRFAEPRL
jgi:hypothetical protein